ncbi:MAG TPA: GntR family transcriptional regulator [Acidimicrobiales bacterium]
MASNDPTIRFRLDPGSGVSPYRQLVDQVREALVAGRLRPGDQLPAVREVVTQITINPNTVHRAYRELEYLGLTIPQRGLGTFIAAGAVDEAGDDQSNAAKRLRLLIDQMRAQGASDEEIRALVSNRLESEIDADS